MDALLEWLHEAHGPLATALEKAAGRRRTLACQQRWSQEAGRGYGILNRIVHANPEHWAHGMGGIANAEQASLGPLGEPIELDGEQLHLLPALDRLHYRL